MKIKLENRALRGLIAKTLLLSAGLIAVSGCAPSPKGYYGSYPDDYSRYDANGNKVVVVHPDNSQSDSDDDSHQNYDNHWDYGRRGNGNFHGTGDDDVHDN